MMTDRTNQTLILKDSRCLGFAEYGVPNGVPVFYFHGSGSSRLERPSSDEILIKSGVRYITTDRPGHGLSDFQPKRRLLDWPKDIQQVADHLGIDEFYVAGHSAGGPHALACAYQLPDRVLAGAVISSIAPMSRPRAYEGMPLLNQILARSSRRFPWITKLIRRIMRGMIMSDVEKATQQLMSSIPTVDKAALFAPENTEILIRSIREGFRQNSRGVAQDDILVNQDWGFDLASVRPHIDIWHGEADVNVPLQAGKFLQKVLPNTRATFLPGEGHFFALRSWDVILKALVYDRPLT